MQETKFRLFLWWSDFLLHQKILILFDRKYNFSVTKWHTSMLLSHNEYTLSLLDLLLLLLFQNWKKKVESYTYYIICFVLFSRMYKISNISSDQTHVFINISIDINISFSEYTLCYCPLCFVSNSKTIRVWSIVILLYFLQRFGK